MSKPYLRILASHLLNRRHVNSLYSALTNSDPVSDLFAWSNSFSRISFLAENVYALYLRRSFSVSHGFTFLSSSGEIINRFSYQSSSAIEQIDLQLPTLKDNSYSSFVHHLSISEDLSPSELANLSIIPQSRSYTTYYPSSSPSVGSTVHGNFGGITSKLKQSARIRPLSSYTPTFLFEANNLYDLVFSNPLPSTIKVIIKKSDGSIATIELKPLATSVYTLSNYYGTITIIAPHPLLRPTIFVNNLTLCNRTFDVFHS